MTLYKSVSWGSHIVRTRSSLGEGEAGKREAGDHSKEKEEAGEVDIGVNHGMEADLTDSRVNRGSVAWAGLRSPPAVTKGRPWLFTPPSPPNSPAAANLARERALCASSGVVRRARWSCQRRKSLCLHGWRGSELPGVPCEREHRHMPRQYVVVFTISS